MTKEDKELLLNDLSARLQYRPKVEHRGQIHEITALGPDGCFMVDGYDAWFNIDSTPIKPYLRSMSDIVEFSEEDKELMGLGVCEYAFHSDIYGNGTYVDEAFTALSWLLKKHYDVNGLIEKGLAIKVTPENNPYK